jgi:hypothetical protein
MLSVPLALKATRAAGFALDLDRAVRDPEPALQSLGKVVQHPEGWV